MVILGIDPGLCVSGFGIIQKKGSTACLLDYGYLALNQKKAVFERLGDLYAFFAEKIQIYHVTDIALETPFLGKNAQNFLKLGYVRGIIYLLASQNNLTLHEFSPRQVKLSVTGFGGAQKDQVARAVMMLLPHINPPKKYDVTDALAVTLCGMWHVQV